MRESLYVRANGINIHYLREGRGPPLILVHGWPEFCAVWQPVMAILPDRFELFAPDLKGLASERMPTRRPRTRRQYSRAK